MKLNSIDNINFSSRNPDIRKANDLVRCVNNLFPRTSTTKCPTLLSCVHLNIIRSELKLKTNDESVFNRCSLLMDLIKKYKVGNCGESSFLAKIVAECNGIKNTRRASLYYKDENCDHSVLYVNNNKKPYIIDCWLGFADYVPKAFERFAGEYINFINEGNNFNKNLLNFRFHNNRYNFVDEAFSEDLIKQILDKYPELSLKNRVQGVKKC